MRSFALFFLTLLAAIAAADRLILIPTGNKLRYRTARIDALFEGSRHNGDYWLGAGITRDFELEVQFEDFSNRASAGTLGFSYNLINPLTDFAPGVSVGVQDLFDRTQDGRRFFLASTYRIGQDGPFNSGSPLEATLGVGVARRSHAFVGVDIPFRWSFHGLVEHDGHRITSGLEYQPVHGMGIRWLFRPTQTLWELRLSQRF